MRMSDSSHVGHAEKETLLVEVVYASVQKQKLIELQVPKGSTALDAVRLSKIAQHFPEIDLENLDLGVFAKPLDGKGRPLPHEYIVQAEDRVEIYRPLTIDPMQARLERAEEKRQAREAAKVLLGDKSTSKGKAEAKNKAKNQNRNESRNKSGDKG